MLVILQGRKYTIYMKENNKIKQFFELFALFFKIGLVTFGGGLAMLPILESELVEKRDWATKDQLMDYFAIGQATPGIIAVNVATFIGYTRLGTFGGIIATLGVIAPSLIIITVIAKFFTAFTSIEFVKKMLWGVNIAVAALLTKVLWNFRKNIFKSVFSFLLFAAAFVLIVIAKVNTAWVILGAIAMGLLWYSFGLCKNAGASKNSSAESIKKENAGENQNRGEK